MALAVDVAKYILIEIGETSAMKLQKLVYYSQAWSLVWDEAPLFDEDIHAWINGPIVPELYGFHKGQFKVTKETFACGNTDALDPNQKDSIDKVLEALKEKSGQWLSDSIRIEGPWNDARKGLEPTDRGASVISLASIHEYYSSF
jgi:uncharacterized phage-associated protein